MVEVDFHLAGSEINHLLDSTGVMLLHRFVETGRENDDTGNETAIFQDKSLGHTIKCGMKSCVFKVIKQIHTVQCTCHTLTALSFYEVGRVACAPRTAENSAWLLGFFM